MNLKDNVPEILKGILETNEDWLMEGLCRYRMFDRIEIGFCAEWAGESGNKSLEGLQINNRLMTNGKNKYLTIFESIPNPVIILTSAPKPRSAMASARNVSKSIIRIMICIRIKNDPLSLDWLCDSLEL